MGPYACKFGGQGGVNPSDLFTENMSTRTLFVHSGVEGIWGSMHVNPAGRAVSTLQTFVIKLYLSAHYLCIRV